MMKLAGTVNGKKVVVLGLSHGNLDRLRADGVDGGIAIRGAELGLSADIYITAAETESHLLDAFASGIGTKTKVFIDRKLKT